LLFGSYLKNQEFITNIMELLTLTPSIPNTNPLSLLLAILAGVMAGILINYFADVLPVSRRLTRPTCPKCRQLIPLKNYLFNYRCPSCGNKKSARSLMVLILSILSSILLRLFPFATLGFWASLPLLVFLGVILVIDVEHRLVLIETSLFGMALCLVYGLLLRGLGKTLLGALAGFAVMLLFYLLGNFIQIPLIFPREDHLFKPGSMGCKHLISDPSHR